MKDGPKNTRPEKIQEPMVSLTTGWLIVAHAALSLGGLLIHLALHPVMQSLYYFWAAPADGFSLIVLPMLFLRRSTVGWACLLNALVVSIGVIGMAYYSIIKFEGPLTVYSFLTGSTVPFIAILMAKLPIAQVILILQRSSKPSRPQSGCRP